MQDVKQCVDCAHHRSYDGYNCDGHECRVRMTVNEITGHEEYEDCDRVRGTYGCHFKKRKRSFLERLFGLRKDLLD